MQDSSTKGKLTVDELMPSVYQELRRIASRYLLNERPGHTLGATGLVHEMYVRMASRQAEWEDKLKFLAAAATAMRHILVDHARGQKRVKRGGRPARVTLAETHAVEVQGPPDLLDLDNALEKLARQDARKAQIVELLFFGGLTYEESAAVLNISLVTVYRELRMAKAWLYRELTENPGSREAVDANHRDGN